MVVRYDARHDRRRTLRGFQREHILDGRSDRRGWRSLPSPEPASAMAIDDAVVKVGFRPHLQSRSYSIPRWAMSMTMMPRSTPIGPRRLPLNLGSSSPGVAGQQASGGVFLILINPASRPFWQAIKSSSPRLHPRPVTPSDGHCQQGYCLNGLRVEEIQRW